MADTTTTLNPGFLGDVMNEELGYQSDGITQAKSPRVVTAASRDPSVPALTLASDKHPMPVENAEEIRLLRGILDTLVDLRSAFAKIYNV